VQIVLCCCYREFYCAENYEWLQVSAEVKELFEYVTKYVLYFSADNQYPVYSLFAIKMIVGITMTKC